MLSQFSRVWLFETLWTVACQAPLSMGFSKQEYGVGCHALLRDSSQPRDRTASLTSPALAGGFFTTSATCKAPLMNTPAQCPVEHVTQTYWECLWVNSLLKWHKPIFLDLYQSFLWTLGKKPKVFKPKVMIGQEPWELLIESQCPQWILTNYP